MGRLKGTPYESCCFYEHGELDKVQYTDVPEPQIGPDEVLLEVKAAALNRLDLWVLAGWPGLNLKLPHIMGSDGRAWWPRWGANVSNVAVGDCVAVNPSLGSDSDYFGQRGFDNMSDNFAILGEHVDGFFAEYAAVPARNLLKMPDEADFISAAPPLRWCTLPPGTRLLPEAVCRLAKRCWLWALGAA
ncbi:MAG: alcohol dehydrogenase catalytic domain-containing protein [Ardenticatenaceae bacterium]|nr:alcohol dehydrogenase catalytic domain-containing protein [Ardenticatenaceae bacterium]